MAPERLWLWHYCDNSAQFLKVIVLRKVVIMLTYNVLGIIILNLLHTFL